MFLNSKRTLLKVENHNCYHECCHANNGASNDAGSVSLSLDMKGCWRRRWEGRVSNNAQIVTGHVSKGRSFNDLQSGTVPIQSLSASNIGENMASHSLNQLCFNGFKSSIAVTESNGGGDNVKGVNNHDPTTAVRHSQLSIGNSRERGIINLVMVREHSVQFETLQRGQIEQTSHRASQSDFALLKFRLEQSLTNFM